MVTCDHETKMMVTLLTRHSQNPTLDTNIALVRAIEPELLLLTIEVLNVFDIWVPLFNALV